MWYKSVQNYFHFQWTPVLILQTCQVLPEVIEWMKVQLQTVTRAWTDDLVKKLETAIMENGSNVITFEPI